MSNSTSLKLREEVIFPLTIISLIISISAFLFSIFSGISYAFIICSYFYTIPAAFLGVLIITQKSSKTCIGISIANLIICKMTWIAIFIFSALDILRLLKQC